MSKYNRLFPKSKYTKDIRNILNTLTFVLCVIIIFVIKSAVFKMAEVNKRSIELSETKIIHDTITVNKVIKSKASDTIYVINGNYFKKAN